MKRSQTDRPIPFGDQLTAREQAILISARRQMERVRKYHARGFSFKHADAAKVSELNTILTRLNKRCPYTMFF